VQRVSIVIPIKDHASFLPALFESLCQQTFKDFNVIIVDSSCPEEKLLIQEIISKHKEFFEIKYHSLTSLNPGEARNFGIAQSNSEIIAFLDSRTLPLPDWLNRYITYFDENKLEFYQGSFVTSADSYFQRIVKAATYGNLVFNSLPGSLLLLNRFREVGDFANVRAGEDQDWLKRANQVLRTRESKDGLIIYKGMPETLFEFLKKWFVYSMENAKINIEIAQKLSYGTLVAVLLAYFFYSWNYFFTDLRWDSSPFFVPNLNKIIWSLVLVSYFFYRSLILPKRKGIKLSFLFPLNWIVVGIISIIGDLMKLPGRIIGFIYLLFHFFK
jgi:glycosyltransferase involved in cell wall biosynthesis